jgi:hypothetical protein
MDDHTDSIKSLKKCVLFEEVWDYSKFKVLVINTLRDHSAFAFQVIDIAFASDDRTHTMPSFKSNRQGLESDITSDTGDLPFICENVFSSSQRQNSGALRTKICPGLVLCISLAMTEDDELGMLITFMNKCRVRSLIYIVSVHRVKLYHTKCLPELGVPG